MARALAGALVALACAAGAAAAGPPPQLTISPAPPVDLGPVRVGTRAAAVTLTVTANAAVQIEGVALASPAFAIVAPLAPTFPIMLTPGATRTMTVDVGPTAEGPVTADVVLTYDGTQTLTAALTAEGVVPRPIGPDPLALGTLCASRPRTRALVVSNIDGTGRFAITGATSSNPAFTVAPRPPATLPLTVLAGDEVALDVQIAIADTRTETATLTIETDVPGAPLAVAASATGGLADGYGADPAAVEFTAIRIGAAAPSRRVTFRNCTAGDHTVDDIVLGGTDDVDFLLGATPDLPAALPSGDALEIGLGFTPSRAGVEVATLTFTHDGPGSPTAIMLTGTGIADPIDAGAGGGDDGGCCGTSPSPGGAAISLALVALGLAARRRRRRPHC